MRQRNCASSAFVILEFACHEKPQETQRMRESGPAGLKRSRRDVWGGIHAQLGFPSQDPDCTPRDGGL